MEWCSLWLVLVVLGVVGFWGVGFEVWWVVGIVVIGV
jgi:hypothetical protein